MAVWLRIRPVLLWAGIILLIFGAKLWLIERHGSSLPIMDQIDGEGERLLRPWFEGRFNAGMLWSPHNEHRIVLTKLYTLGLTLLNGQWDAYVQVVANALLHALFVPVLLAWLHRRVQGVGFVLLSSVVAILWILPLGWENTLQGFQSQFYFLIWLSYFQIRGVLSEKRFGWAWAGGQVCGLLALGTMASGLLSSLAVIGVVGWGCIQQRRVTRWELVTLILSAIWVGLGWFTRNPVAGHDYLRAETPGEAVSALANILAWPLHTWLPFTLVFALPLVWWTWQLLRQPERDGFESAFIALALWFGLNALSLAVLRNQGVTLSSRYTDIFAIGLVLQGVALAQGRASRWRQGLFLLWVAGVTGFLVPKVQHILTKTLPARSSNITRQESRVRDYFATQDSAHIINFSYPEIPHPSGEMLHQSWQHTSLQQLMPAAVRAPLIGTMTPVQPSPDLPPAPYPILAISPLERQTTPWLWRSERFPASTLPVLRFKILGALGDPQAALAMHICTEHDRQPVVPDGPARHRWKTINVMRPMGEWWIELEDSDSLERVALTAPVELGRLSWAAEKLIKYHLWWLSAGLGCVVLGSLLMPTSTRRS
jgi:hypothetical protein